MTRLSFPFTYNLKKTYPFHVICAKSIDFLPPSLQEIATQYGLKDGKKFMHEHTIVIGCGDNALKAGRAVFAAVKEYLPHDAKVSVSAPSQYLEYIKDLVTGIKLQAYEFLQYKTTLPEDFKRSAFSFEIVGGNQNDIETYDPIVDAVMHAKEFGNEPPNILYPETFANRVQDLLKGLPVKVTIFDEKELEKRGMGGILAVGQGSRKPPRLVTLEYTGGIEEEAPLAFVGKAITFDTGGISIKPSMHMEDMRHDMCGGAAVAGLFYALAKRGAKVNAIGVIGMAENMPDGNAYRPADIVTTASGKTIEVLNTDAEGRVVLADALWHAASFKPKLIVDLATLTGAITVALGSLFAGIFTESDELSQKLIAAGNKVGEPLWRMPLHKQFTKDITSKMADVRNTSAGKGAGSSTAAAFLREFVPKEIEWCHMDIAGVAYGIVSEHISSEGASGFGVRLLDEFVRGYES